MVTHIMQYLSVSDRKDAALVCRRWYQASLDPKIQKNLVLSVKSSVTNPRPFTGLRNRLGELWECFLNWYADFPLSMCAYQHVTYTTSPKVINLWLPALALHFQCRLKMEDIFSPHILGRSLDNMIGPNFYAFNLKYFTFYGVFHCNNIAAYLSKTLISLSAGRVGYSDLPWFHMQ